MFNMGENMATEFYIVKPSTKQTFYLGKRISCLEGINNWVHKQKADYPEWEEWEDVVFDLQENSRYFLEGWPETTVGQIWDFCYKIWEFCDSPVYMDNDCNDENQEWRDWECINVFDDIFGTPTTELEKWSELYQLVPHDYWVIKEEEGVRVLYEYETVKNYLVELAKQEEKNEND